MSVADAKRCRGLAARANYIDLDRPKLQFAAKEAGGRPVHEQTE